MPMPIVQKTYHSLTGQKKILSQKELKCTLQWPWSSAFVNYRYLKIIEKICHMIRHYDIYMIYQYKYCSDFGKTKWYFFPQFSSDAFFRCIKRPWLPNLHNTSSNIYLKCWRNSISLNGIGTKMFQNFLMLTIGLKLNYRHELDLSSALITGAKWDAWPHLPEI